MLHYRFPLFLAVGITCLGLTSINTSAIALETKYLLASEIISQAEKNEETPHDKQEKIATKGWNYQDLMEAGYAANRERDYVTALENFQKALALRPNDSVAQTAIANVSSYAFDAYMQAGYQADNNKDYLTALANFQRAREIRPDSFYAQQAVRNVSSYLIVKADSVADTSPCEGEACLDFVNQTNPPKSNLRNNIILMLLGLVTTAAIAVGVFLLLMKKTHLREEEVVSQINSDSSTLSSQKQDRALQISAQEEKTDKLEADSTATKQSSFNPSSVSEQANTANPVINLNTNGSVNKSSSPSNSGENGKPIQQASVNESNLVSSNGQISKLDIVPELIKDLQQSDRALRRKTIWELAQRADSRAMKPLVELMIEADSQERSLILEAMTQIASRTLKPMNKALMISLQDENSQVRQNAIRDLTRVYELMSQVTKRLALAVEDSDAEVKETAKWALSQLNQIPQVPWNDE